MLKKSKKQLSKEQRRILNGERRGLNEHAMYERWISEGFEIPEDMRPNGKPKKLVQPARTKRSHGGPGTELKKQLSWIESVKPEKAPCTCETLAAY